MFCDFSLTLLSFFNASSVPQFRTLCGSVCTHLYFSFAHQHFNLKRQALMTGQLMYEALWTVGQLRRLPIVKHHSPFWLSLQKSVTQQSWDTGRSCSRAASVSVLALISLRSVLQSLTAELGQRGKRQLNRSFVVHNDDYSKHNQGLQMSTCFFFYCIPESIRMSSGEYLSSQ